MKVYNNPTGTIEGGIVSKQAGSSMVDKNGFLKLLAAELQNQDPMKSADTTQYVAQMAQFAALEQITNLNSSIEKLLQGQKFEQGSLMIGSTVKIAADDGTAVTGVAESVKMTDGGVKITVGGKDYDIDRVSEVAQGESGTDVVSGN